MTQAKGPPQFEFLKLTEKLDRGRFDCGEASLNDFLRKTARQNQNKNLSVTTAVVEGDKSRAVVGYHTLAIGTIERESLPPEMAKKLPRYPIPVVRIGRLAVDNSMKGKGLGKELLIDALARARQVHETVPIYAVVVDALHDEAKRFYLKYGFISFHDRALSLFLPIHTVLDLFPKSE